LKEKQMPNIREAVKDDVPVILSFIKRLAEYEKALDRVTADEALVRSSLFGSKAYAQALIVEEEQETIAVAVYFFSFSTFSGRPNLYLEDIFVLPAHRGTGAGKQLMAHLARIAVEHGCGRMEWAVLDWNEPAMAFYRSLGAEPLEGWTVFHLEQAQLTRLANFK
jgi:GNAT superfamily N-acetyltransferase